MASVGKTYLQNKSLNKTGKNLKFESETLRVQENKKMALSRIIRPTSQVKLKSPLSGRGVMSLNANIAFTPLQDISRAEVHSHKVNNHRLALLSVFRGRHAHHAALGCRRVWQSVQPFHRWPAMGACRRHAAGAEACLCR